MVNLSPNNAKTRVRQSQICYLQTNQLGILDSSQLANLKEYSFHATAMKCVGYTQFILKIRLYFKS